MTSPSHDRDAVRNQLLPRFEALVDATCAAHDDPAEAERQVAQRGDALSAEAIGVQMLADDEDADRVQYHGRTYRRLPPTSSPYRTLRGTIRLLRHRYRPTDDPAGATICPMDLRRGILEDGWTTAAAQAIAYSAQKLPERRVPGLQRAWALAGYSASSIQRVARKLGRALEEVDPAQLDEALVAIIEVPEEASGLSVMLDRVSVRLQEKEEGVVWRMAYVGCVTLHDEEGAPVACWRYGALPHQGADELRRAMRRDVEAIEQRAGPLAKGAVSDGSHELWDMLQKDYPHFQQLLDLYHLLERLGESLRLITSSAQAAASLAQYRQELREDVEALAKLEARVSRWPQHRRLGKREPVVELGTYLANQGERMGYVEALEAGLPVGSGMVEATCKQLVALRMKRNGQRFKPRGGAKILQLRSLAISQEGRWEAAMGAVQKHLQQE